MGGEKEEDAPRRTYLKRFHFDGHGYTDDCEGCSRLSAEMTARPHTEVCRKRMYEAMRKTEDGRKWMERADDKINEYMEEKEKEREEKEKKKEAPKE